ncbi:MAG TPA: CvpA family protein [Lacibacter sp.]|nr:CvpA family protein [Lacibacter sp.]HMO88491.1 CvpA family protein [Lacibacter sp.]HMP87043.1 CvpA family protein [Lacibacter sp.]
MLIDLLTASALVLALVKGLRTGLIMAVFSLVAWVIGMLAALRFSTLVAGWLGSTVNLDARWLPALAFLLVFLAVVLLVRLLARMVEGVVELAWLGWFNKLAGVLLYAALYLCLLSFLLFYARQLGLLTPVATAGSLTAKWVEPLGPGLLNTIGTFLPPVKTWLQELEHFFDAAAPKPVTMLLHSIRG